MSTIVRPFIKWYTNCLEHHPYTTKALTSGFVSGAGDLICQTITNADDDNNINRQKKDHYSNNTDANVKPNSSIDWKRTFHFTLLGTILVAPIMHVWYGILNHRMAPGSSIKQVFKRTFYDQTICAPLFIPTFMISLKTLEGDDIQKNVIPQLKYQYKDIILTNWILWIPAQIINFRFVPINYQVLCSNVTALIWNIYFSYKTHVTQHNDEEDNEVKEI